MVMRVEGRRIEGHAAKDNLASGHANGKGRLESPARPTYGKWSQEWQGGQAVTYVSGS